MKDEDAKQHAILSSAWEAFATYGYRKTSMDDIARGAGISRPAVYLHYKNKDAIFRCLVETHYQRKIAALSECLEGEGSVPDLLGRAMAKQGEEVAALLHSPHGLELLDAGTSAALDLIEAGEDGLRDLYADWLLREADRGRVRFDGTAHEVAGMFTAALKGIKKTAPDVDTYFQRVATFAALVGAGLSVR